MLGLIIFTIACAASLAIIWVYVLTEMQKGD